MATELPAQAQCSTVVSAVGAGGRVPTCPDVR